MNRQQQAQQQAVNILRAKYVRGIRNLFAVDAPIAGRAFDWLLLLIEREVLTGTKPMPMRVCLDTGETAMLLAAHLPGGAHGCAVCNLPVELEGGRFPAAWSLGAFPIRHLPEKCITLHPRVLCCPGCTVGWEARLRKLDEAIATSAKSDPAP